MTWDRILFLVLLAIIFISQAASLMGLMQRKVETDRGSAWGMVLAWNAILVACGVEAIRYPDLWREPRWLPFLGVAAFVLGFWLRLAAVRTLDKHFSPLVELQPEHELVTHGPYAWVRHPAYLGSLLWAFAPPLLLGSAVGLGVAVLLYYPALRYRVAVEERLLAGQFGDAWTAYRQGTPALIPLPRFRRGS